jgi:hypothetical protein
MKITWWLLVIGIVAFLFPIAEFLLGLLLEWLFPERNLTSYVPDWFLIASPWGSGVICTAVIFVSNNSAWQKVGLFVGMIAGLAVESYLIYVWCNRSSTVTDEEDKE